MFHGSLVLKELTSKWAPITDVISDGNGVTLKNMRISNIDERSTVPNYMILKTASRLITRVGNRMNHHSSWKWSRLCNRYKIKKNHLEQIIFQLNPGRHQEKKVLIYISNCVQNLVQRGVAKELVQSRICSTS